MENRPRQEFARHREGPVPRADHTHHASRDPVHEHALAGIDGWWDQSLHPGGVGRCHLEVGDKLLDLVVGLGPERLPLVQREGPSQVVPPLPTISAVFRMTTARSNAERDAESRHVAFAAAMAHCASSRTPSGTLAMTSPVEGLVASNVAPEAESTHFPPISIFRSSGTGVPSPLPGLEGALPDLLVRADVELAWVPHGLGVVEGDLRQHRDLVGSYEEIWK